MHLKRTLSIDSSLPPIPTYFLPIFIIPIHVANRIKNFNRTSCWGVGDNSEFHLVDW